METKQYLKTRVPASTKELVRAAAAREYLTEATWFRRVVEGALRRQANVSEDVPTRRDAEEHTGRTIGGARLRIYVRLRHDDRIILQERATARGMPSATYAAALLRSHLRNLPPLPTAELTALKRAVAEINAVGRNLNQIAEAANRGDRVSGPSREDLRALIRVCEALRNHVKDLLKTNQRSWTVGHGDGEG